MRKDELTLHLKMVLVLAFILQVGQIISDIIN